MGYYHFVPLFFTCRLLELKVAARNCFYSHKFHIYLVYMSTSYTYGQTSLGYSVVLHKLNLKYCVCLLLAGSGLVMTSRTPEAKVTGFVFPLDVITIDLTVGADMGSSFLEVS